jgi:antitoxin (DNA-binding transcriptional repressor) of toxin-antitoxin stability system
MLTTAKELRFNTSAIFERLDMGEEITITYRGKAKAKLVPFEKESATAISKQSKLFGIWKDKEMDVDGYIRNIREARSF